MHGDLLKKSSKLIVHAIAQELGLHVWPWMSSGEDWCLCRLGQITGINDFANDIVVCVSDGGIISVNGDSHTPDTRELNDSYCRALKSIKKWVV